MPRRRARGRITPTIPPEAWRQGRDRPRRGWTGGGGRDGGSGRQTRSAAGAAVETYRTFHPRVGGGVRLGGGADTGPGWTGSVASAMRACSMLSRSRSAGRPARPDSPMRPRRGPHRASPGSSAARPRGRTRSGGHASPGPTPPGAGDERAHGGGHVGISPCHAARPGSLPVQPGHATLRPPQESAGGGVRQGDQAADDPRLYRSCVMSRTKSRPPPVGILFTKPFASRWRRRRHASLSDLPWKGWYHVSEFDEEYACWSCFTQQRVNFGSAREWQYKADGLFRIKGSALGSLAVIVSLWRFEYFHSTRHGRYQTSINLREPATAWACEADYAYPWWISSTPPTNLSSARRRRVAHSPPRIVRRCGHWPTDLEDDHGFPSRPCGRPSPTMTSDS
jgi:hypothetical protein